MGIARRFAVSQRPVSKRCILCMPALSTNGCRIAHMPCLPVAQEPVVQRFDRWGGRPPFLQHTAAPPPSYDAVPPIHAGALPPSWGSKGAFQQLYIL